MARGDLKVTIDADAARLEREIQRTNRAIAQLDRELSKANRTADQFDRAFNQQRAQAFQSMGRGMAAFGAATLAGLGLATKAAIDWESAWAGVVKVVEGSPEQLAALEGELRNLAKTLPASHAEIAGVAEAAGQLGVRREDIASFTKTMIDLGVSTNLSAQEAATGIARLSNIMGTSTADADKLGSALVALGNAGASTEAEILEMGLRIAGAGKTIGLTEGEVLGFANALSSVGINAEAGGSSISRVFIKIEEAVQTGGESLDAFASVAGMSAQQFSQAYEQDAAGAIVTFISGLGRMQASGENVFAVLDRLGLSEVRVRDALLRAGAAQDVFTDSIELGNRSFEENNALIAEASRRYDTKAAKIKIARNAVVDLAIDIGNVVLPAVGAFADTVKDIADVLSNLPAPVKTAVTVLAGLAGVVTLAGGGFLLLAPRVLATQQSLQLLATTAPRAAAGLRLVGMAAGIVGVLGAVATAIFAIGQASKDSGPGVGEMTKALLDLEQAADSKAFREFLGLSPEAQFDLEMLGLSADEASKAILLADENITSLDGALASLVSGGESERAEHLLSAFAAATGLTDEQIKQLMNDLPQYRDALASVAVQQQITGDTASQAEQGLAALASQFGLTGEDAVKAAQGMLSEWSKASAEFVSLTGAYETVLERKQEAEKESAQATADATSSSTDSWEDYVKDVDVTLDEYLAELEAMVKAQEDWAINMGKLASRVPAEVLDELARLGPEGAPLVADLVDASDEELDRFIDVFGRKTVLASEEQQRKLAEAAPELRRIARQQGQEVADAIWMEMVKGAPDVRAAAEKLGIQIDEGVGAKKTRKPPIKPVLNVGALNDVKQALDDAAHARQVEFIAQTNLRGGGARFQHGGQVPGSPTQAQSIIAHGTEWVINPRASAFYGDDMLRAINEMRFNPLGLVSAAGPVGSSSADASGVDVRVFIGDRELTHIVRTEISAGNRSLKRRATAGAGVR